MLLTYPADLCAGDCFSSVMTVLALVLTRFGEAGQLLVSATHAMTAELVEHIAATCTS